MSARRNVLAGLLNSAWYAVASFAVVPFYLHYLGAAAYGLIGFFLTLQGLLLLLDLGLTPAVSREVAARARALSEARSLADFLHSVAVFYWGVALAMLLVLALFSAAIASYWLQPGGLGDDELALVVVLMGVAIACRFPHGIYRGALIGAERLVLLNTISIVMVTLANFGAVFVLAFISTTVKAFFLWQVLCSIGLTLLMRRAAWSVLAAVDNGARYSPRFDTDQLRRIWRFSAGMTLVSIASITLLQMDKLLLSNMLPLADYGIYMVAVLVGSALAGFFMPVFNVIYPKLTVLFTAADTAGFEALFCHATRLLAVVLLPVAMLLCIYAEPFVALWTGDAALAAEAAPLIGLIATGYAINGIMSAPYAALLAHGRSDIAALIAGCLALLVIPLIIVLAGRYGGLGGAASWLIVQGVYLFLGGWLTHRKILRGSVLVWLARDVGIPLFSVCAVGSAAYFIFGVSSAGMVMNLLQVLVAGLAALLLSWLLYAVFLPGWRQPVPQPG